MPYIYFSPFLGKEESHGGVKRSLQIQELLEEYNCISLNPYLSIRKSIKYSISSPIISLKLFFFATYLFFLKGVTIKGAFLFILKTSYIMRVINRNKSMEYIFEGGTTISILIMYYLSSLKIHYHIFPQNIEYLAPKANSDGYFKENYYKYSLEIKAYQNAKSVTTVSIFDKAILDCHQISSFLLPSYPTNSSFKNYSEIAEERKLQQKNKLLNQKNILLIGTTYNHPTREGLRKLLNYIQISQFPYQVTVIGYGTSEFCRYNSDRINVLGTVSEEKLKQLMIETTCLLINTIQTSGYLFKVVEFNLSGIPIIFTTPFIQHENLEKYGIFNSNLKNLRTVIDTISFSTTYEKFKKPYIDWL